MIKTMFGTREVPAANATDPPLPATNAKTASATLDHAVARFLAIMTTPHS